MSRTARRTLGGLMGAVVAAALVAVAGASPTISYPTYLPSDHWGTNKGVQPYSAITCLTTNNCEVVGPDVGQGSSNDPTAIADVNGNWRPPVGLSLPKNSLANNNADAFLTSVACWSASDCVAVGGYSINIKVSGSNTAVSVPMVATEHNGSWARPVELAVGTGVWDGAALVVWCSSTADCVIIGLDAEINVSADTFSSRLFEVTDNSGALGIATFIGPKAYSVVPTAIACTTTKDCVVSFTTQSSSTASSVDQSYLLTETNGHWGSGVALAKDGKDFYSVSSLSCPSAGDCVSVGTAAPTADDTVNDVNEVPAAAIETKGSWGHPVTITMPKHTPATAGGWLSGVSCDAVGNCVGVGQAAEKGGKYGWGMTTSLSGTAWSPVVYEPMTVRSGSGVAKTTALGSIACTSKSSCIALGAGSLGTINSSAVVTAFVTNIKP